MSILDELDLYDEKKNGEYQNFNENDEKKESSNSENINNGSIDFTEDDIEKLIKRIIDSSLKQNNANLKDKIDTLISLTKETNSEIKNLSFNDMNKELESTIETIEEIRETVYEQLLNYQKNVTERFKIMLENLIEVTSKLREINIILNENLGIDNFINKVSENKNKNNRKSNFIIYTLLLIFGILGLVIFKLRMR